MATIIQVSSRGKMTTLRVSEATKRYLEFFGRAGETHDEMLFRILNTLKHKDTETQIFRKNNVLGTKYGRLNRTFGIETDLGKYTIICTYNDISPWALLKNHENLSEHFGREWELSLEMVNVQTEKAPSWSDPKILYQKDKKTWLLLYFISLKEILESFFDIRIYEISTIKDYLSYELWKQAYLRNKLSMESFHKDIEWQLK